MQHTILFIYNPIPSLTGKLSGLCQLLDDSTHIFQETTFWHPMPTPLAHANPSRHDQRSIINNMSAAGAAPRQSSSIPLFARVPTEIWVEIASFLCDHCQDCSHHHPSQKLPQLLHNKTTLSALAETCRWLRAAIQAVLHHQFPFANYYYLHPKYRSVVNLTDRLYLFVRTLVTRPDLAKAVESLKLRDNGYTQHLLSRHRHGRVLETTNSSCHHPTNRGHAIRQHPPHTPPSNPPLVQPPFVPDNTIARHPFFSVWWSTEDEQREREREWDPKVVELAKVAGLRFAVDPETAPRIIQRLRDSSPSGARRVVCRYPDSLTWS
jgi:hypothetical protein